MDYEDIVALWGQGKNTPEMAQSAWAIGETSMAKDIAMGGSNWRASWIKYEPLPLGAVVEKTLKAVYNDGSGYEVGTVTCLPVIGTNFGFISEVRTEGFFSRCFQAGDIIDL